MKNAWNACARILAQRREQHEADRRASRRAAISGDSQRSEPRRLGARFEPDHGASRHDRSPGAARYAPRPIRRPGRDERARHQQADLLGVGLAHRLAATGGPARSPRGGRRSRTARPAPRRRRARRRRRRAGRCSAWRICAAAPTSTPQVGCATISTFGCCRISRPTMNFCRLPPDRLRAPASRPAGLHAVRARSSSRRSRARRRARMKPRAHHAPGGARSAARCRRATSRAPRRGPSRSSGTNARPSARRCAGIRRPAGDARRCVIASASASGRSPESAASSSCWPLPETPAMPTISPACTVEADVARATCRTDRRPAA